MAQGIMENIKLEPLKDGRDFKISVTANHTFGTDAVLLSNFANARKDDIAVDIGTGCGIIGFLMLRDGKTKKLYGVDISEEAIALCYDSVQRLCLEERFFPVLSDVKALKGKIPSGEATLVVCNPPYKASGRGIQSKNERAAVARHEVECTLEDIIEASAKLLNTGGRLCMCQRPERLSEMLCIMSREGIEPKRLRLVAKTPDCEPWLVLVEGKKGAKNGLRIAPTLFVENADGSFSDEMLKIYGIYKP